MAWNDRNLTTFVCIYICIYIYICVCVCLFIYIYIYTLHYDLVCISIGQGSRMLHLFSWKAHRVWEPLWVGIAQESRLKVTQKWSKMDPHLNFYGSGPKPSSAGTMENELWDMMRISARAIWVHAFNMSLLLSIFLSKWTVIFRWR